jgi:hypothetical protein
MRKTAFFILIVFLFAGVNRLSAQSLQNTAWKFYVDALHDTLTMHIGADTAYSTSSTGELIVRSHIEVVKDTLKLRDIDGEYPCMDGEGVYRFAVDGDYLSFFLVNDPCENRSGALRDLKMKRTDCK